MDSDAEVLERNSAFRIRRDFCRDNNFACSECRDYPCLVSQWEVKKGIPSAVRLYRDWVAHRREIQPELDLAEFLEKWK